MVFGSLRNYLARRKFLKELRALLDLNLKVKALRHSGRDLEASLEQVKLDRDALKFEEKYGKRPLDAVAYFEQVQRDSHVSTFDNKRHVPNS